MNDLSTYQPDYDNMSDDEIEYINQFSNPSTMIPKNLLKITPTDIIYDDEETIKKFLWGKSYGLDLIEYFLINGQIDKFIIVLTSSKYFAYCFPHIADVIDITKITSRHINSLVLYLVDNYVDHMSIYGFINFYIDLLLMKNTYEFITENINIDIVLIYLISTDKSFHIKLFDTVCNTYIAIIRDNIEYIYNRSPNIVSGICRYVVRFDPNFILYILKNYPYMVKDSDICAFLSEINDYNHAIDILNYFSQHTIPVINIHSHQKLYNGITEVLLQLHKENKIYLVISYASFLSLDLMVEYYITEYAKNNNTDIIFNAINHGLFSHDPTYIDYGIYLHEKTKHLYDKLPIKKTVDFTPITRKFAKYVITLLKDDICIIMCDILPFVAMCDNLQDTEYMLDYAINNYPNDCLINIFSTIYSYKRNGNHTIIDTEFELYITFIKEVLKKYHNGSIQLKDDYGYDLLNIMNCISVEQAKIISDILLSAGLTCSFDNYDMDNIHNDNHNDYEIHIREPIETICWLDELVDKFGWIYKNMDNLRSHVIDVHFDDPMIHKILINGKFVEIYKNNVRNDFLDKKYADKYFIKY